MMRFSCFSTPSSHRSKKVVRKADAALHMASLVASQIPCKKTTNGSSSFNQRIDELSPSEFKEHVDTSLPDEEYCRSEDLNRYSMPDGDKTMARLKKSQSLGNLFEKQENYDCAQNTEGGSENHGFASSYSHDNKGKFVEGSIISCCASFSGQSKENATDCLQDALYHASSSTGTVEPCEMIPSDAAHELYPDHARPYEESLSCAHPRLARSHSVEVLTQDADTQQGAVNSDISRHRSFQDFSSVADAKVDYVNADEEGYSNLNVHVQFAEPSHRDNFETSNSDERISSNRADADEDRELSIASDGYRELGSEMLNYGFWKEKSVCSNYSADGISHDYAILEDASHHSEGDGISEMAQQDRHHVPEVCDFEDIYEAAQGGTQTGGENFVPNIQEEPFYRDNSELTPKAFAQKRIEDWINLINIGSDMIVEEHGGSSSSVQGKVPELLPAAVASRPDAKTSLGMEMAYKYISSLTPASSSAQLSNLGLVAIPVLSAFVGLRLVNLSGNFLVRITTGALPKGLHMLYLSKNNISTIEGLRDLTRLRVLDISYNRISRIGHGLASCSSLKELYLAGNKISEIDGLHRLLKLKVLDLRNNKISTLKGLGQLAANYNSLEAVNLEGNPAQKNVGEEHLKKFLLSLLPHLAYYNKQSARASGSSSKEASDRHGRMHSDRTAARSDRKSSSKRLPLGSAAAHKAQSSLQARTTSRAMSTAYMKPSSKSRNPPLPPGSSKPADPSSDVVK